ncbi:MAG: hypothetical protein ACO1OT_14160 [Heyndrickxia sp.]
MTKSNKLKSFIGFLTFNTKTAFYKDIIYKNSDQFDKKFLQNRNQILHLVKWHNGPSLQYMYRVGKKY